MISIIIPALEEEKYIEDTVRQFEKLSFPHEVIVSDGHSHDRTVEISRACADKVVVFQGARHNPSIGRNDGAKAASGDILVFVDGSVIVPDPDAFFRRALSYFENDASFVSLSVPQWVYPEKETMTDKIMLTITNWVLRIQNNVFRRGVGSGKFMMLRRRAFEKIGGFREDLATREDGDLGLRISKVGRAYFDPKLCIYYSGRREHAMGWARLLWMWMTNSLAVALFDKSVTEEWKPIR
ncbi:MAG: Glycosyl transferase family 2 [Parcubacteria group bacterium GW2011_GWA2_51_10]|nr:MAG: Glycosyl transferase family 2 [Parcubacteria group bacterium GW2011_GWA2_51_10]